MRNRVGSIDCINSQEFDEFKPIILNHFKKLNLKNDQQAIQIVHQKKTILELKNLIAKYDNTSTDLSPEDSTIFNATSPVKPSKVICKRLFDIQTIYKPGVTGPPPPKKNQLHVRAANHYTLSLLKTTVDHRDRNRVTAVRI